MVLNTWEAVYFDHNLTTLIELADSAAELGVERFVLDDGWFRGRRDDHAGLGDWYVDETLWPSGLTPLIDAVTSRGMEFGLWVEPEMVNLDSDVVRAHPEWIVGPSVQSYKDGGRLPLEWRHQHIIDLVNPDAWQYIYDRVDALLRENNISYLKWDQNRDLLEHGHAGRASVHEQTLAAYRLFDALKAAHPGVEIESCSSGGARVDLGILERTDRIWASDCNDALERQTIQRWTGLVVPPELVGGHVGPTTSHTTARTHDLSFRALTALFGHFGMEWDVRQVQGAEREELKRFIGIYKEHRGLIHSGRMVRADLADESLMLHGVVADTSGRQVSAGTVAFGARRHCSLSCRTRTSFAEQPGRITVPWSGGRTCLPGGGDLPGTGRRRLRAHVHAGPAAGMAGLGSRSQRQFPCRGRAPHAGPQPGTRPVVEVHGALAGDKTKPPTAPAFPQLSGVDGTSG